MYVPDVNERMAVVRDHVLTTLVAAPVRSVVDYLLNLDLGDILGPALAAEYPQLRSRQKQALRLMRIVREFGDIAGCLDIECN